MRLPVETHLGLKAIPIEIEDSNNFSCRTCHLDANCHGEVPCASFEREDGRDVYFILADEDPHTPESDPLGKNAHEPGAKLDAGKNRPGLVLFSFARALDAVTAVGTYGANKYSDNGWIEVPNGQRRYTDAMMRHLLKEAGGETHDKDTELLHAAHAAWNALARLDLMLRAEQP